MNANESLAQAYNEELPWLAFLYVSEELTPDEVVDFEERLLTDQAAREAVAEAMKMADGLWMATALDALSSETTPDLMESAGKKRTLTRLVLWGGSTIVAASLAFSVGWWFAGQGASTNPMIAQPSDSEPKTQTASVAPIDGAEELLGLWSDSRSLIEEWDLNGGVEIFSEDSSFRESQDVEEEAFAWMLAVVSENSPVDPETNPDVMEN